jgi:hypothetical protein
MAERRGEGEAAFGSALLAPLRGAAYAPENGKTSPIANRPRAARGETKTFRIRVLKSKPRKNLNDSLKL